VNTVPPGTVAQHHGGHGACLQLGRWIIRATDSIPRTS
jgi:hypothetical protein